MTDQILLDDFTVEEMLSRVGFGSVDSSDCASSIASDDALPSTCDVETDSLADDSGLVVAKAEISPDISSDKFLWVITTDRLLVSFEDADYTDLAEACSDAGGNFLQIPSTVEIQCSNSNADEDDVSFQVSNYAICVGTTCDAENDDADSFTSTISATISEQFRQKILDLDDDSVSDIGASCEMSTTDYESVDTPTTYSGDSSSNSVTAFLEENQTAVFALLAFAVVVAVILFFKKQGGTSKE